MTLDLILRIIAWWGVGIVVILVFLRYGVGHDDELDESGADGGDEWESDEWDGW